MDIKSALLFLMTFLALQNSQAMMTEVGLSYGYQKKTYDANNYYQLESKSASLSLYFSERIALELSYTDAFIEQQQKDLTTRTIQQTSKILDASLMVVLGDRKAFFQPYLKGGVARIEKTQVTKYEGLQDFTVNSPTATVPSYGAGLKLLLTDSFSLKVGIDFWRTPLEDGSHSDDSALKAGLSWML